MKRFTSFILMMAMLVGLLPAHAAESRWVTVQRQCAALGLKVNWFSGYEGLMRRYGTDRMLLVLDGQSYLCPLNSRSSLAGPFDAVEDFDEDGRALAARNGKWGRVSQNGEVVTEFLYGTKEEAAQEAKAQMVQEPGGWKYAVADMEGNLLTGYVYEAKRNFSHGFAAVFRGGSGEGWGYVNEKGEEVIPCQYYSGGVKDFASDGYAIVYSNGRGYNVVDTAGREVFPRDGYIREVWRAGQGLWGRQGENGVEFWSSAGELVHSGGFGTYTDPKGFTSGNVFDEEGRMAVYSSSHKPDYYVNIDGERVEPPAEEEYVDEDLIFHEGLRWVNREGKHDAFWPMEKGWGFENEAGELVVPYLFDAVGYFDHGYASVMVDGVFGLLENPLVMIQTIDAFEKATGGKLDVTWVNTDCALVPLSGDQLIAERKLMGYSSPKVSIAQGYYDYGLLDLAGRRLVPTIYGHTEYGGLIGGKRFGFFTGKRSQDGNSVVYTDLLGNEFTPFDLVEETEFDTVSDFTIDPEVYSEHDDEFHEGLLKVRDKATDKWGAVDKTGKLAVPCQWAAMSRFGEGLACVRESENGKEGYINTAGELVMPCILDGYNAPETWYEPDVLIAIEYQGRRGIWRNPTRKNKISDWARAEVDAATQAGYVTESCKAYQTYTITREQFASLAVNYLEKKTGQAITPAPADTFTDTVDEDVLKAYAAGIVQGMGDGLFGPGRPLSREQLATMLWRAMEKAGVTAEPTDLSGYTDNDKVSDWARDSVAALAGLKVMEGNGGGLLSPKNSCTVEQAILLVYRAAK